MKTENIKVLNSKERQYLKGLAHNLDPVMIIGKGGVTETLVKGLNESLNYHELLKIKFGEFKDQKEEICGQLSQLTQSTVVNVVGNVATFYRKHKDAKKRKIVLPV